MVSAAAAAAPSGVVTFLFTDVEGSTRRWEADAQAMRAALVVHDKVLRAAIVDGDLLKPVLGIALRPMLVNRDLGGRKRRRVG